MLERARPDDAASILSLREAAARWLLGLGIAQWMPGEVTLAEVHEQVMAGHWWVRRQGRALVGALRLLDNDPEVWGPDDGDALYVHGLVTDRARAPRGLGADLLGWAGERAAARGRAWLRLDCVETNERLRRYYAGLGFTEVGRVEFSDPRWFPAVLLSRPGG
ncbi:MAG: GNAT family N-acetyltransferase [Motilibacteraceae bacterium]